MHAWVHVCWQVWCSCVSRYAYTSVRSMPMKVQIWHPVSTFMELYLMYLHGSLADPGTHRFSSSGWVVYPGTPCLHHMLEDGRKTASPAWLLPKFWKSEFYPLMFVWQLFAHWAICLVPSGILSPPQLSHCHCYLAIHSYPTSELLLLCDLSSPQSLFFFPKFVLL